MSQHKIHILIVLAITMVMSIGLMVRSVAAQPLNDDFANAFVISGPGFTDAGSTVDATESPDDPAVANGAFCGGGKTVWYTFTPAADTRLIIDTFGSDYDTTLGVYTGSPGDFAEVACNDDSGSLQSRVVFDAFAGVTYGVVIGTYGGALYGGNYVISASQPPPPLAIDLTIESGTVNKETGVATVYGTLTCSGPAYVDVYVHLDQTWSHLVARGDGYNSFSCDGTTPISVQVWPSGSVIFKGGQAAFSTSAYGCDGFTCDDAFVEGTLKLQRT